MVAGYPGRTSRYALAGEFDETAQWAYPQVVEHYGKLIELVEAAGKQDEDIAVKYASSLKGWHNVVKNYQGQLDGFARIKASERKHAEEQAVLAWLSSQGDAGKGELDEHEKLVSLQEVGGD